MTAQAFTPTDLSENAQNFLFACAFWIMAADEELSTAEQNWLASQFGEEKYVDRLNEMLELPDGQFMPTFDARTRALTDEERRAIYPTLTKWLCQCVTADGELRAAENEVMRSIQNRIELDAELKRLEQEPEESANEPPPAAPAEKPGEASQPAQEPPTPEPEPAEQDNAPALDRPLPMQEEPQLPEPFQPEPMPETKSETDEVSSLTGHEAEVTAVATHAAGTMAATGDKNGMVLIWDVPDPEPRRKIQAHDKDIRGLCFLADGKSLISADRAGSLTRWSTAEGKAEWEIALKSTGGISGIAASPTNNRIAVASPGCRIAIVDAAKGEVEATWRKKGWSAFRCIAFSPDGKTIAAGGDDRALRLLDAGSGEETAVLDDHDGAVLSVAYSPDGKQLIVGCRDNELYIWDPAGPKISSKLSGHTFSIYGVTVDNNSSRILSASWDHTVKLWDLHSGELLLNYENPDGGFNAVDFLDNKQIALAGCSDGKVYLLQL